jgi:hypothetical protein
MYQRTPDAPTSPVITIDVDDVDAALARLRAARIVAVARDDAVTCDLRSVYPPALDERLAAALRDLVT